MVRNRYVWAAASLLTASAIAFVAHDRTGPVDVRAEITERMRTALESTDVAQHNHAGHAAPQSSAGPTPVVCGVRLYGYQPEQATAITEVRTVYGFHLCGIAEPQRPWDVAVKLAGPVILDMTADPPGIQVVEATESVRYIDRLKQMFPSPYAEMAQKEALSDEEMAGLRERYDKAAGV